MMLRVLLVDDEQSVLNLLRHFITDPEVEIVAETVSSLEAVSLARHFRPDVVISDIRMPELSGLDMVRQMKADDPDIHFIMISGYQDFEYAYHALKLGVSEYLLKPIRQTELLEALDKLKRQCKGREPDINSGRQSRNPEEENRSVRKKSWIQTAVRYAWEMADVQPDFCRSSDCFASGFRYVQGIMVKIDAFDLQQRISAVDVSRYTVDVCRYIMRGVSSYCTDMEYITEGNKGYILLCHNISSEDWDTIHQRYNIYVKEENYKYEGHLVATIGIGSRQEALEDAPLSFLHARQTINGRIEYGAGKILEYDAGRCWNGEKITGPEDMRRYQSAVQNLDAEAAVLEMKRLLTAEAPDRKGGYYYAMAEQIMELAVTTLMRLTDTVCNDAEDDGILETLDDCFCPEHVIYRLERWLHDTIARYEALLHSKEGRLIKTVKAFVEENYFKPIGLNETAEVVSLNPIYFSALFREQTGEKFTTYLQNVRIGKAKHLLKTTNLSIKKVAEQVGYIDEKYFSRLFLKATGVKPVEYRKYYAQ